MLVAGTALRKGTGQRWEGASPLHCLYALNFVQRACITTSINHGNKEFTPAKRGRWIRRHRLEAGRPQEVVLGTQWGDDRGSEQVMAMEMEKEDGL